MQQISESKIVQKIIEVLQKKIEDRQKIADEAYEDGNEDLCDEFWTEARTLKDMVKEIKQIEKELNATSN
jgi:phage shock protein A